MRNDTGFPAADVFNKPPHTQEGRFQRSGVFARPGDDQFRPLPGILVIRFHQGHIKAVLRPVFDSVKNFTFFLEGMCTRKMQFKGQDSDGY